MSILIKNKEMPKNCNQCVYRHLTMKEGNFCTAIHERINYRDEKLPNCPIIEIKPHGRLIDADAFKKYISVSFDEIAPELENGYLWLAKRITEDLLRDIDEAPTIIEAEEDQA